MPNEIVPIGVLDASTMGVIDVPVSASEPDAKSAALAKKAKNIPTSLENRWLFCKITAEAIPAANKTAEAQNIDETDMMPCI